MVVVGLGASSLLAQRGVPLELMQVACGEMCWDFAASRPPRVHRSDRRLLGKGDSGEKNHSGC